MRVRVGILFLLFALAAIAGAAASCGSGNTTPQDVADGFIDVPPDVPVEVPSEVPAEVPSEVASDIPSDVVEPEAEADAACLVRMAVVTDIDATLTTSDAEWLAQIVLPSHDPAMRPDANTLFQDYAARGYEVFYITARGSGLFLLDGTSARDATAAWLQAHDFPYDPDNLFLSDGVGAWGTSAADYKTAILADLHAAGWRFIYGYGNSDTDVEAFLSSGIPAASIFFVTGDGPAMGVSSLPAADAYTQHIADHMPTVPEATCMEK
jgi:hypothetical protein